MGIGLQIRRSIGNWRSGRPCLFLSCRIEIIKKWGFGVRL
jgi:hypothetical protein